MKILIVLSLIFSFVGSNLFAQKKDFYTITFSDSLNQEVSYSGVEVISIDNVGLSFKRIYNRGDNITPPKIYTYKIPLEKINSFGYRAYTPLGTRITTGAAIGTGIGLGLGAVAGSIKLAESYENHTLEGALAGAVLGAFTGSIVGGVTGIGAKEYESVNLTKYSKEKKYQIIQGLMTKGINFNKDE